MCKKAARKFRDGRTCSACECVWAQPRCLHNLALRAFGSSNFAGRHLTPVLYGHVLFIPSVFVEAYFSWFPRRCTSRHRAAMGRRKRYIRQRPNHISWLSPTCACVKGWIQLVSHLAFFRCLFASKYQLPEATVPTSTNVGDV